MLDNDTFTYYLEWHTVKRKITDEDLFGEIGEVTNFAKISTCSHQNEKYVNHPLSSNNNSKLNLAKLWYFQNRQI